VSTVQQAGDTLYSLDTERFREVDGPRSAVGPLAVATASRRVLRVKAVLLGLTLGVLACACVAGCAACHRPGTLAPVQTTGTELRCRPWTAPASPSSPPLLSPPPRAGEPQAPRAAARADRRAAPPVNRCLASVPEVARANKSAAPTAGASGPASAAAAPLEAAAVLLLMAVGTEARRTSPAWSATRAGTAWAASASTGAAG